MITIAVPDIAVADALGDLGDDTRVVVWDPREGEAPEHEKDRITIMCIPHFTGGRKVYGRVAQLPNLRVIQIPSAGYEHVTPFVPAGVALANARGVHDSRTAEFAITLALASLRGVPRLVKDQADRAWNSNFYAPSLVDRRALVVGYGSIGAAIGSRLRAMEAHVEGVATSARVADDGTTVHAVEDLRHVLPHTQVVFVVTPHTPETDNLVDAEFLSCMPDGALLVNVGRGKCVDQDALLAELASGRLHAALDVTDPEPLPPDHPLWAAPGLLIAPHIAGGTALTDRRYTSLVRQQVEAVRRGDDPANLVMLGGQPA
jgi:phosphoglycerate dehydrogenase-like enzyme